MDGFLSSWLQTILDESPAPVYHLDKKCPSCGMAWSEVRKTGKLGCSECYNAFFEEIKPTIQRIQENLEHVGKIPMDQKENRDLYRKIEGLQIQMKNYVDEQRFEEAAKIRDQIQELREKGELR